MMEYFPGVSLQNYVEQRGVMKPHEYLAVSQTNRFRHDRRS